jgi:hypothetical protein
MSSEVRVAGRSAGKALPWVWRNAMVIAFCLFSIMVAYGLLKRLDPGGLVTVLLLAFLFRCCLTPSLPLTSPSSAAGLMSGDSDGDFARCVSDGTASSLAARPVPPSAVPELSSKPSSRDGLNGK